MHEASNVTALPSPGPSGGGEDRAQPALAALITRHARGEGLVQTAVPELTLARFTRPQGCNAVLYDPRLYIVAQGRKATLLGGERYHYDPLHYLVISTPLPAYGEIVEASPEHPYLALKLTLDPARLHALVAETGIPAPPREVDRALYAARATTQLLDPVLRLVRLLDRPADLPVLAPMLVREIHYRLLTGEFGHRLAALAHAGTRLQRISRAVDILRRDYAEPLRIEALAASLHMSSSSLHHQFKALTAMSPLQFQKQIRLHEARRLMLVNGLEAGTAAHRVGYESASQFSREYKRLFGAPPRRDTERNRADAAAG